MISMKEVGFITTNNMCIASLFSQRLTRFAFQALLPGGVGDPGAIP